jgi:hypothetical protein
MTDKHSSLVVISEAALAWSGTNVKMPSNKAIARQTLQNLLFISIISLISFTKPL